MAVAQDRAHRRRASRDRGAARSRGDVRAAAHWQTRAALHRAVDDKVIALYARGLTVREIQAFLKAACVVDVSPDLISAVTDAM